ncbi:MAG: hypothetical protein RSC06_03355 [Clostridia bacterium]
MTIDLNHVAYRLVAALSDGSTIDLTNACEQIGWEENSGELSSRINITLRDVAYQGAWLKAKIALCTKLYLYADIGQGFTEVWRGTVWEWESSGIPRDPVTLTGYDMLYPLQKSSDNFYFAKGKDSRAIIDTICKKWKVMIGRYEGPTEKHGKLLYKNKRISDSLKAVLEDAEDKGAKKCVIRSHSGKMDVLPYGYNADVFRFSADENVVKVRDRYSTTDLVTRVVIVGKSDGKGRPKVAATINGKTQYGILQTIQTMSGGSLADAKKQANKLLKESGQPKRTLSIQSADVPLVRKGDQIYLECGSISDFFIVLGVSHDVTGMTMSMEVEAIV